MLCDSGGYYCGRLITCSLEQGGSTTSWSLYWGCTGASQTLWIRLGVGRLWKGRALRIHFSGLCLVYLRYLHCIFNISLVSSWLVCIIIGLQNGIEPPPFLWCTMLKQLNEQIVCCVMLVAVALRKLVPILVPLTIDEHKLELQQDQTCETGQRKTCIIHQRQSWYQKTTSSKEFTHAPRR